MKSTKLYLASFFAAVCVLSTTASAAPLNYTRLIQGNLFQGAQLAGSYLYEIVYNADTTKLEWVDDPATGTQYAPRSAHVGEYYVNYRLLGLDGAQLVKVERAPITQFTLVNNFEVNFGNPQDVFSIRASGSDGVFTLSFTDLSAQSLQAETLSELGAILEGQREDIFLPRNGSSYFPSRVNSNFAGFDASVSSVGMPVAFMPTPDTLPLALLALGGLLWTSRRIRMTSNCRPSAQAQV